MLSLSVVKSTFDAEPQRIARLGMLQVIVMGQLALYALNVQVCVAGDPVPVYEYDIDVDDSTAVRVANEHGI